MPGGWGGDISAWTSETQVELFIRTPIALANKSAGGSLYIAKLRTRTHRHTCMHYPKGLSPVKPLFEDWAIEVGIEVIVNDGSEVN